LFIDFSFNLIKYEIINYYLFPPKSFDSMAIKLPVKTLDKITALLVKKSIEPLKHNRRIPQNYSWRPDEIRF